jgi:hypothetical protein
MNRPAGGVGVKEENGRSFPILGIVFDNLREGEATSHIRY